MSPSAASALSPKTLDVHHHKDRRRREPDGVGAHAHTNAHSTATSSASPSLDTVNVKTQSDDGGQATSTHPEDDGEQPPGHSGDEGSDQDHDNDEDEVTEVVNRNGKRKRPISVSYVRLVFCVLCYCFEIVMPPLFSCDSLVAGLNARQDPDRGRHASVAWCFPGFAPVVANVSTHPRLFYPRLLSRLVFDLADHMIQTSTPS